MKLRQYLMQLYECMDMAKLGRLGCLKRNDFTYLGNVGNG